MGLLDLFSRKSGNRAKANVALKHTVYNSAAARSLPTPGKGEISREWALVIRSSSHPKVGNPKPAHRPYYVGTLPRGRPQFTQPQLSFDTASEDERSAPDPRVPVFRDESVERPSTAPGTRPSSALSPNSGLRLKSNGRRRPPPLTFRMARPETAAAESPPGSRSSVSTPPNVFRRGSEQSGATSLRSGGSKAFKDVLDAQSEIRPAYFRERVKAAGTRDYGEDVADRNMGQNGFDIEADHVRAFYAQSQRAASERTASPLAHNRPGLKLSTQHAGGRIEPFRSSSQQTLSGHVSPVIYLRSGPNPGRREGFGRRRSFSTFIHLSSDHIWRSPSALRLPETAPAPAVRTAKLPRDSVELAKKRADPPVTEDAAGDGLLPKATALHSTTRSRRSSTIASAASASRKHHSLYTLRSSVSSSVFTRDTIIHATPLSYPHGATRQRHAAQELAEDFTADSHSILSESNGAFETNSASQPAPSVGTQPIALAPETDEAVRPPSSQSLTPVSNKADFCDTDIALPDGTMERIASIRTRSIRALSASSSAPTATDSFVTATSHPSHSPPPSLGTAVTSVDLDIGAAASQPKPPRGSINHEDKVYDNSNSKFLSDDGHGGGLLPPETPDTFNIDEYLSTDDADSVATTPNRRPTAEGEEDLLFNDAGYGAGGMQLPGLPDPFPASSSLLPHAHSEDGKESSSLLYMARLYGLEAGYWDYGIGVRSDESLLGNTGDYRLKEEWERRRRTRRFVLDTAADDEDYESGSGSEWDPGWGERERGVILGLGREVDDGYDYDDGDEGYDADVITEDEDVEGPSPRKRMKNRTRRFSALCRVDDDQKKEGQGRISQCRQQQDERPERQHSDAVEERPESKFDVADAVRLRKEVKRARRLAGEPSVARLRRQARMSMPELHLEGNV
ncbi:hypothetical protein C8A03DRAFT_14714 [Achaetomium macrosporum]|uniref:Uncharacterized protein n=1 Tax=Achaetomium macrosporum TaxID=79813 RepID=A0AAN7CCL1_9PEZI|nr:hypothetical protein C8A03DRAFT_14714 [Achaetomium macrosporum]